MSKKQKIYQVDAFTDRVFEGNPAAVCPLDAWLADETMQLIAMENNLSETAFFVHTGDAFELRWFTPQAEVDLCGHATLAAAHVLFAHSGYALNEIVFKTASGALNVKQIESGGYRMNFPVKELVATSPPKLLLRALGLHAPLETFKADDYMLVLENEQQVRDLNPDFNRLKSIDSRGIIVTAAGDGANIDFVSRFFAPAVGINEDPVTGSAHTMLTPYWAHKLNKKSLRAQQLSHRGGTLHCALQGNGRLTISGTACTFMVGELTLPS